MRVIEALRNWDTVIGTEIEIEGIAEVSHSLSIIYEDPRESRRSEPVQPGILVHGDCLEKLISSLPKPVTINVGSEILYVINVKVRGIVANSGYRFAPIKIGYIYEIEFGDECSGLQKLIVNPRLKDVVFRIHRTLKAGEVRDFETYFPEFENRVELKKYLECGKDISLGCRILETEVREYTNFLDKMGIEYQLCDSPIENGFSGLP